jgi:hypothetical protein
MRCHTHQLIQTHIHIRAFSCIWNENKHLLNVYSNCKIVFIWCTCICIYWKKKRKNRLIVTTWFHFQGKNNKIAYRSSILICISIEENGERWIHISCRFNELKMTLKSSSWLSSIQFIAHTFKYFSTNEQKRLFSLLNLISYRQLLTCSFTVLI